MKSTLSVFIAAMVLQGTAFAADGPKIQVNDGKISMSVEAMPLGRLLSLFDRAMGMTSEIKPELSSRSISVQFTDLEFDQAVKKMFQGQPLNYFVVGGGIRVVELAQSGPASPAPASTVPSQPSVQQFDQQINVQPLVQQPLGQQPQMPAGMQPINVNGQPVQNAQPNMVPTVFGPAPNPNANQMPSVQPPAVVPGQVPLAPGAVPPPQSPAAGPAPVVVFPSGQGGVVLPGPTPVPQGPGTSNAVPGTISR